MGFLQRIIASQYRKADLKSEVKEDLLIIKKFLKIYESKINGIKKLIPYWEGTSIRKIGQAEEIFRLIPEQNRQIQSIVNIILKGDKLTEAIKELIQAEVGKYKATAQKDLVGHLNNLDLYFKQLGDNLKFLKNILYSQSQWLVIWRIMLPSIYCLEMRQILTQE